MFFDVLCACKTFSFAGAMLLIVYMMCIDILRPIFKHLDWVLLYMYMVWSR